MQSLHRSTPFPYPVKIVQFGEGNFLRAFFDWQIDILNERCDLNAGIVIVRPIAREGFPLLDTQDGLYTTLIRGLNEAGQEVNDQRIITCVQQEIDPSASYADYLALAHLPELRFIVSNTTEAGITTNDQDAYHDAPPVSFPAKLTRLLHERFVHFKGAHDKGLVLLPCELLDHNGDLLQAAILHFATLWQLDTAFTSWLNQSCTFCSTLVDRIVTGYPREEAAAIEDGLGYRDAFMVSAEYFHLLVIEGPASLAEELKLAGSGLNIRLVSDITPYKQRKVGVLNGGHTTMVPVALLAGLENVLEAVNDPDVGPYLLDTLHKEIIPALPLPREELDAFAADVLRRFQNPSIHHRLATIALNSWSKFAARVLPQLLTSQAATGIIPVRLVLALAATMNLYRGDLITLADDADKLEWFAAAWKKVDSKAWSLQELAQAWLAYAPLWGRDLNTVPDFTTALTQALEAISHQGIRATLTQIKSSS